MYSYQDLIRDIVEYYGPYRQGTSAGKYVLAYLKKDIKESMLSKLFPIITYYCRLSDYAPGISDIEYAIKRSGEDGKAKIFHISKHSGAVDIIRKHKEEVESLPESEVVEFENEGDLFKSIIGGVCNVEAVTISGKSNNALPRDPKEILKENTAMTEKYRGSDYSDVLSKKKDSRGNAK